MPSLSAYSQCTVDNEKAPAAKERRGYTMSQTFPDFSDMSQAQRPPKKHPAPPPSANIDGRGASSLWPRSADCLFPSTAALLILREESGAPESGLPPFLYDAKWDRTHKMTSAMQCH